MRKLNEKIERYCSEVVSKKKEKQRVSGIIGIKVERESGDRIESREPDVRIMKRKKVT